jgi:hypothetical protein
MNKLETIRQKCIEANPDLQYRLEHLIASDTFEVGPIRLADVLLAMHSRDSGWTPKEVMRLLSLWNLREDDLTKQSPETIQFLASLLT